MTTTLPVLREDRRTAEVLIEAALIDGTEKLTLCELPCRNDFLVDMKVPGLTSRSQYRSRGSATVTVAWSKLHQRIAWRRMPPSAKWCDLCGDEWRYTIPRAVAAAERQKARWAALSDDERASAASRLGLVIAKAGPETPSGVHRVTP